MKQEYVLKKRGNNEYKLQVSDHTFIQYNEKKTKFFNIPKPQLVLYSKSKLGEGAFGTVYPAHIYNINYKLKNITHKYGNKVIKVMMGINEENKDHINQEYNLVKKIPRIGMKAPVFEGPPGKETCYLIMNHLPGQELKDLINNGDVKNLSINKKLELTYKLLLALDRQVTSWDIVHRDIKPENILVVLDPEIRVNIIDYGFAKKAGVQDETNSGTPHYAAPEIFHCQPHDVACDVYSMAKTIATLWVIDYTFYRDLPLEKLQDYSENSATLLPNYLSGQEPNALVTLLQEMLEPDQKKRISIQKAIAKFESAFPNQKQILKIRLELRRLKGYSNNIEKEHPKDARIIDSFINKMNQILNSEKDITDIKNDCSTLLQEQEIKTCSQKHKQVGYFIKNLAAAICSLGIFYLAACAIQGRFSFFHNPVREACDKIEADIKNLAAPAA